VTDPLSILPRLESAARDLAAAGSGDRLHVAIADLAADTFLVDIAALYVVQVPGRIALAAKHDHPGTEGLADVRWGEGVVGRVAESRKPRLIPDVRADPGYDRRVEGVGSEVAVPLVYGSEIAGVLDLQSREIGAFSEVDLALLKAFASCAAGAMESVRLRESLDERIASMKKQLARLDLIHRVGQTFLEAPLLEETMQRVIEMVATALDYNQAAVLLLDRDLEELRMVSAWGYGDVEGLRIPLSHGATGYAARNAEPVVIGDVTTDPRYVKGISVGRSELAVPIVIKDRVVGVLDVESPVREAFGEEDVELLRVVASYAAGAIGRHRLKEETERQLRKLDERARRLDLLGRVSRTLTRHEEVDELLSEILRQCSDALDLRHCAVLLPDPEEERSLILRAAIGYDASAPRSLGANEGITGHVFATGVPVVIPDVTKDRRYVTGVTGSRAEMAAPLRVFGRIIGVLDAESSEIGGFDDEDLDLFTSFAAQAAIALHSAELASKLDALERR